MENWILSSTFSQSLLTDSEGGGCNSYDIPCIVAVYVYIVNR